ELAVLAVLPPLAGLQLLEVLRHALWNALRQSCGYVANQKEGTETAGNQLAHLKASCRFQRPRRSIIERKSSSSVFVPCDPAITRPPATTRPHVTLRRGAW